jgi:hypothetical protein
MYRPVKAGELFATFIFDGKDCADMGVYSITSGSTYTMSLGPNFKDETLEVPAYDGRYYYGTQYTTQQFQFNLFADNLSVTEYRNLRTWLKPRNIGKLILSDQPYKYYIVKVTSVGTLGAIPLTDAQHVVHSVLGDMADGNVVYTGKFSVTFQTVGSCYGYGLSYYRDDLIYDALNNYGVNVYPENYYYDSGLLYKDMSPALTRTMPANAKDFDLTIYNPGSAPAIPTIHLLSESDYPEGSVLEITNETLGTHSVIDIGGLSGDIEINTEEEIIKDLSDGVTYFGRFSGNPFEVGEETDVITIPETFTQSIEEFYFRDYDSIYVMKNTTTGRMWAHINPLVMKVDDMLIGKYFCINGNGGAKIEDVDLEYNAVLLSDDVNTYEILPSEVTVEGEVKRPSGMEFRYIGEVNKEEDLPTDAKVGDVASITYTKISAKGEETVDHIDMFVYRDKWEKTNLFYGPHEFYDMYGDIQPKYMIFGANIVDVNKIVVNTNFGECDISISLLRRYI